MPTYGTNYGGWWLPNTFKMDSSSIVISAGVGEDISFDLAIQSKFGCSIYLFDPTERAVKHYEEVIEYYKSNKTSTFTGTIQVDYHIWLNNTSPDFSMIEMNPIGLWKEAGILKFYKQTNPNYVSQTLVPNLFGTEYTEARVARLSDLLKAKGLKEIAILKLDIEGAEMEVLETLLEDGIFPQILCVEFDYFLKGADTTGKTKDLVGRLMKAGYEILHNANSNITFRKI
jgi:FkbM family methyltransferase